MLLHIKHFFILLLIFGITGCTAQVEKEAPNKKTEDPKATVPWRALKNQHDHDPYFTENTDLITKTAPATITRNVLQTKDGKVWLATWNGIVCYDGTAFTNYTNKAGLRRHRVFTLLEDKRDDLWFGTIGAGVYRYNGSDFTNFTTDNGLASNMVECIMEDKAGNLWFGTHGGVSRYDGTMFQNFTSADGLPDNEIHSIAQDQSGKIWVASTGGLSYLDGQSFLPLRKADGQPFSNVRNILPLKSGELWFGGSDGLIRYDGSTFTTLLEDFVGYLYEDRAGDIWVSVIMAPGSEKTGLYRFAANSAPLPFTKDNFTQILQVNSMVFGITEDTAGNIWFGTVEGVCQYDGEGFEWFREG
ncbi:ligand-binding sensor domain-containing protein [Neolewinella persica]|uniref:ligand-binding sensor domain-containing protein n=1 Tax=Neolewinella persica TaxID=70998 RepID=UPI00037D5D7A|nr:two-component regulator propeller domain-containing protein [Neolewinella persica]